MPETQRDRLLAALSLAGSRGVSTSRLVEKVGHRFASALARLRAEGYVIETTALRGALCGESRYVITYLPDGSTLAPTRFPTLDEPALSVRRAYISIVGALRRSIDGDDSGLADIEALLLYRPELLANRSIRHNLGAKKTALLDRFAAELGLEVPASIDMRVSSKYEALVEKRRLRPPWRRFVGLVHL